MFRFSLIALTTLAVACGAPEDDLYDDVAEGIGGLSAAPSSGESVSIRDLVIAVRGDVPAGLQLSSEGSFTGLRDELELKLKVNCSDTNQDGSCKSKADVEYETKGKTENFRYKLEIDRKLHWKAESLDQEIATVNGTGQLVIKSEIKSKVDDTYTKYSLDYEAQYKNVQVRTADQSLVGGEIHFDVHAKQHEKTDDTKIKEDLRIKAIIQLADGEEPALVLDEKYRYRLKVNGEVVRD